GLVLPDGGPVARAQPAPPATTPPPPATVAPSREVLAQRPITVDEAVAFSLENQPNIRARLGDYAAAKYRVDQALAPLLPQVAASVSTSRSQTTILTTSALTGITSAIQVNRDFSDTLAMQITLSQLLFDFGKNAASTEAARKLSE